MNIECAEAEFSTNRDGSGRQDLYDTSIAFAIEAGDRVASAIKNVRALIQPKSFPNRGIRTYLEKSPRGAGIGEAMIVQYTTEWSLGS